MATTITFNEVIYYEKGVTPASSSVVGYETLGPKTRVARYSFTTPAEGGNHIAFSTGNISFYGGDDSLPILFFIGTNPDSHANAVGEEAGYHGTVTLKNIDSNVKKATGEADILLLPNTTYYLWFFPGSKEDYFAYLWYARNEDVTYANIDGAAGLVRIDTGTKIVTAIPYIDNGTEWKQAMPYIDNGSKWQICG